jgi:hypothetical protein
VCGAVVKPGRVSWVCRGEIHASINSWITEERRHDYIGWIAANMQTCSRRQGESVAKEDSGVHHSTLRSTLFSPWICFATQFITRVQCWNYFTEVRLGKRWIHWWWSTTTLTCKTDRFVNLSSKFCKSGCFIHFRKKYKIIQKYMISNDQFCKNQNCFRSQAYLIVTKK